MSPKTQNQKPAIYAWLCLGAALVLSYWTIMSNHTSPKKSFPTAVITNHTHVDKLTYQSIVQAPIHFSINTPVNGIIQKMPIPFGQIVEKNDTIATITSDETRKQFNESLIHFLKSKEQLQSAKKKYEQNQQLLDAGIISEEEHQQTNDLYNSQKVEFLQTQNALKVYSDYFNLNFSDIVAMDFSQTKSIQSLLEQPHQITLKAPGQGILLNPTYLEKKSDKTSFTTGNKIEANAALAIIGQPGHFNIELSIPETDIARVKENLPVVLHPLSNPSISIHGHVTHVDRYNIKPGSRDDIAYFPVHITAVCETNDCPLQSGMSTEVTIILQEHSGMHVPTSAVKHKDNLDLIMIENQNTGVRSPKPIQVISSDPHGLIIDLELQPGEEVVTHYPMP